MHVITDFSYFKQYLKNQYLFSQVIKTFSPKRIRNFVSCFIHDTVWAYPSITTIKKQKNKKKKNKNKLTLKIKQLMLLTFSFDTSLGR